jgi:hypothetical protein
LVSYLNKKAQLRLPSFPKQYPSASSSCGWISSYMVLKIIFQFQPDFAVVGVGEKHAAVGVEEVVAKDNMNLVGGGPVGTETVENTQVIHIGIGEGGER